jgi:spore germination protein GerM
MDKKRIAALALLFVLLVVLVVLFFLGGRERPLPQDPIPNPSDEGEDQGNPRETRTVRLFFLSQQDRLLHPEEREIYTQEETVLEAKQTIEELVRGSRGDALSPIPTGTRLREVYITREGIAYVDFSRELKDNHPSGSTAEAATVFAIVNSLTSNFKSIKRVFILIEGSERETLNGHIDLTRPLLPRLDLIAN